MVIYAVSEIMDQWRVTRYDPATNSARQLFRMLGDKNQALTQAILKAEDDRPSKIMQISREGHVDIVMEFEEQEPETSD